MSGLVFEANAISNPADARVGAGQIENFLGGLTGDRFNNDGPSLSSYFTERGVDAGLSFHDKTPKLYIEASPWALSNIETPDDGARGMMIERNGHLSFGALVGEDSAAYVSGEYSVRFGDANWVPPVSYTIDYDGFHAFENSVTTLGLEGYADTNGGIYLAGTAEHERRLTISDREFGLSASGAAGYTDQAGLFARAQAEINTILHNPSDTYGYLRGEWQAAQNEGFDTQRVEMGIGSTLGDKIPAPFELGVQYNEEEFKPAAGIGLKF